MKVSSLSVTYDFSEAEMNENQGEDASQHTLCYDCTKCVHVSWPRVLVCVISFFHAWADKLSCELNHRQGVELGELSAEHKRKQACALGVAVFHALVLCS